MLSRWGYVDMRAPCCLATIFTGTGAARAEVARRAMALRTRRVRDCIFVVCGLWFISLGKGNRLQETLTSEACLCFD